MDGGYQGRLVFGALRALRGGDVERTLGVDAPVSAAENRPRKGAVFARVLEQLPSLLYRVELEKSRQPVLAHAGGGAGGERNFMRLRPGDRVELDMSPTDPTRGRIVRKIQNESTRIGKEDLR